MAQSSVFFLFSAIPFAVCAVAAAFLSAFSVFDQINDGDDDGYGDGGNDDVIYRAHYSTAVKISFAAKARTHAIEHCHTTIPRAVFQPSSRLTELTAATQGV